MASTSQGFGTKSWFIIANEACERFSFYGMRNILTVFLIDYLLRESGDLASRQGDAKAIFHLFVSGVYFFPLLGGYLSDRFFGKYHTIFWLSLVYCAGHACLAIFEHSPSGFYFGLFLIALGSGGIKPCVSAMVGDQFTSENKHLVSKVFAYFYWSINLGSFFASLLIPKTLKLYGPSVAFGIPGVLMFIATIIFWLGRNHYVRVPPTGPNPHSFWKVVVASLQARGNQGGHWLDGARAKHPPAAIDGAKAVLKVLSIFLPVPFFWMLFDQKASTWVVQAKSMDLQIGPWLFEPSQMQLVNPAMVMILIPLLTGVVYPAAKRFGWELTPLRRTPIGIALGAFAFGIAGFINIPVANGERLSILWQALPYIILTLGEIFVSTTGLEFAYSQAPREMKGTIMSLWNLTVTAANLVVAGVSVINIFEGTTLFFFYAGLAFLAAGAMALIGRRYVVIDHFQQAPPAPALATTAPRPS
jgi:POT family proton-dependent oligopeptide transporter